MALLASTSLGVAADTVRAVVQSEEPLPESRTFRLVVQSYDVTDGDLPGQRSRPVASAQRAVTGAELRAGVAVSLVELRTDARDTGGRPIVVAWLEDGEPDLEFDARRARPGADGMVGISARRPLGAVSVTLKRRTLPRAA